MSSLSDSHSPSPNFADEIENDMLMRHLNKAIVLQDDLIPNFEKMIKQGEVKDRISKNCDSIATDNLEEKKQNKIVREESMD